MKFQAVLSGVTAKDTADGTRIEIKIAAQFDTALFAELGKAFATGIHVQINEEQKSLDFGSGSQVPPVIPV